MEGEYVGPMPVDDFIKDFLPLPAECPHMPRLKKSFLDIGTKTSEDDIVGAINDSGLCSHLVFYNTSQGGDYSNPDMSSYDRSVNVEQSSVIVWPSMELFMERKPKIQDAFQDPIAGEKTDLTKFNFESETNSGQHTRGQITQYAMEQFRQQFRVFCFSVLWLDGGFVRFIRWDRSGAVVTERLNIQEDPRTLADFLWRFGHLNAQQRGRDTTVKKATGDARIKAQKCFNDPENQKYLLDADGKPQGTFARRSDLWELPIHDDETEEDRAFIVASPLTTTEYLTGRCSFGYIAYDVRDDCLVYLKDTWRIDLPDIQKEGSTYRLLHENGVRHISDLVTAGDVIGQRALSKDYQDKPWVCGEPVLIPHQHYRLALKSIGRLLSTFKSSNQLYTVVHHALEAHSDAHSKAKVLHRDVSAGNILIDANGDGLLIDWDLSKKTDDDPQPRRDWRTGTWQFISIDILKDPDMYHELRHDLESFFWVLLYNALRYMDSPIPSVDLPQVMTEVFDEAKRVVSRQIWIGGTTKISVALHHTWHESVPKDDFYESMLGQLLAKFRMLIAPLYMGADARKAALPNFADSTKVLELFDSFKGLGFPENDPSIDHLASGDNKRKADEGMDRDLQDPTVERRSKRSRVSRRG